MLFFSCMAHFDQNSLDSLKKLSRIECTKEEEQDVLTSLSRVLSYIEQLEEVDTEGVEPCTYILKTMLKNRMRQDEIGPSLSRDTFLSNASEQIAGLIRVPPVLIHHS